MLLRHPFFYIGVTFMLNIIKFVKRVSNQKAPENCTIEKAFLFRMQ